MSELKLELGKSYIDGAGEVHTLIQHFGVRKWPYQSAQLQAAEGLRSYNKNGQYRFDLIPDILDLVSEYNFKVGDLVEILKPDEKGKTNWDDVNMQDMVGNIYGIGDLYNSYDKWIDWSLDINSFNFLPQGVKLITQAEVDSTLPPIKPAPLGPEPEPAKDYSPEHINWELAKTLCGVFYRQYKNIQGEWNGSEKISEKKLEALMNSKKASSGRLIMQLKLGASRRGIDQWPDDEDAIARYVWKES